MTFMPSKTKLERYAQVLINFALGKGKGIRKGDVVYLQLDSLALPLGIEVYKEILKQGGFPMVKIYEEKFSKAFFEQANKEQLSFFPKKLNKTLVNTIDHRIYLIAPRNPLLLKNIESKKIIAAKKSKSLLKKWLFEKEDKGKLTWTLALYGTKGLADQAGLSLSEFWEQIEKACFLDKKDAVSVWKKVDTEIHDFANKLNKMPIDKIHIIARNTDLWIELGKKRKFIGGGGANIPSFEIFTSPDWRGTEGYIYFDMPLFRYGSLIKGIYLEFKNGRIVKAKAKKNQKLLLEIISQKNADKVGEFSLTDRRLSRINKFMANTLYDENYGGKYGNSHIAIGSSYHDTFDGDVRSVSAQEWKRMGFNESTEHCDIINSERKMVEAVLQDGTKKVIYKDGKFVM